MNKQKKLTIEMTIFTVFIFTCFGVIIVTEKIKPYMSPKIDKRLNEYINNNYKDILNDINIGKTTYKNTVYKLKVTNKNNKDLYFIVTYNNKKIKDTYNKDYKEGTYLIKNIEETLSKELSNKYNNIFNIKLLKKLNNYSEQIQNKIINNNINNIPIYNLESNITVNWNNKDICNAITIFNETLEKDNYIPYSYTFTIYDNNKIKKPIMISNLNRKIILNKDLLNKIIDDIINGTYTNILKDNNIKYKYID